MIQFQVLNTLSGSNLQALRSDIDSKMNTIIVDGFTMFELLEATAFTKIADYYNTATTTDLWIPNLNPKDLNQALVMTEFQALTVQKQNGWFAMIGGNEVNATIPLVRTNFVTIFGANSDTTTNLTIAAKRKATLFELLVGANSGGVWTTPLFNYKVTYFDIENAIRL